MVTIIWKQAKRANCVNLQLYIEQIDKPYKHSGGDIFSICQDCAGTQSCAHNALHTIVAFKTYTCRFISFWQTQTNHELMWILSSLWSKSVDSCPTPYLLRSIWWAHLLFIRIWGQHQWDVCPRRERCDLSILYLFYFVDINEWLLWLSQYGHVRTACDNASVYWHFADVPCPPLVERARCVCVRGGGERERDLIMLSPLLQLSFTPEAPVAYEANKFRRNHIK